MAKLLLFGSQGYAGSAIRAGIPEIICVDKMGADNTLDYLDKNFLSTLSQLVEKLRPIEAAVIASGLNPVNKVSALDLVEFDAMSSIINFTAPFKICQKLAILGVRNIVVLSSAAGVTGPAGCADYAAWKGALNAAVLSLANELLQTHRINLYSPGKNPNPNLLHKDIELILNSLDSGIFFARHENIFAKLPLGKLCNTDGLTMAP